MFEWDEAKNRSNLLKHGLDFGDAEKVFAGPSITFVDDRFDYGEERLITWACWPAASWLSPTRRVARTRGLSP